MDVTRCAAGTSVLCSCTNGKAGTQTCQKDGKFERCVCVNRADDDSSTSGGSGGRGGTQHAGSPALAAGEAGARPTSIAGDGGQPNHQGGQSGSGTDTAEGGAPTNQAGAPTNQAGSAESGAASQAGASSTCEQWESEVCDGLDNDCDGAIDDGEVCPDDSVHHVEPFLDGVYMAGTLRPGLSDNDVLMRIWPSVADSYASGFDTYLTAFNFRRTDGALFFTVSSSGLHADKPGRQAAPLLPTPPCWQHIRSSEDNPMFGFDGAGTVYYVCDETVRRGNGVRIAKIDSNTELVAVLADGRIVITRPSLTGTTQDFVALSQDGTELARLNPRTNMEGTLIPLTGSASVAGNRAYLAFARTYGVEQAKEVVVFRLDTDSTWQRVRRLSVADFGGWTLAGSDGTVFTRDFDESGSVIHAHLANGSALTAWREGDQDDVHTFTLFQLLVGPP